MASRYVEEKQLGQGSFGTVHGTYATHVNRVLWKAGERVPSSEQFIVRHTVNGFCPEWTALPVYTV